MNNNNTIDLTGDDNDDEYSFVAIPATESIGNDHADANNADANNADAAANDDAINIDTATDDTANDNDNAANDNDNDNAANDNEEEEEEEDEDEEDLYATTMCFQCGGGRHSRSILLCDGCDKGCHTWCALPRVTGIPKGDWFCHECKPELLIGLPTSGRGRGQGRGRGRGSGQGRGRGRGRGQGRGRGRGRGLPGSSGRSGGGGDLVPRHALLDGALFGSHAVAVDTRAPRSHRRVHGEPPAKNRQGWPTYKAAEATAQEGQAPRAHADDGTWSPFVPPRLKRLLPRIQGEHRNGGGHGICFLDFFILSLGDCGAAGN